MTNQQELANTFCDMHKSLYGCRARFCYDWTVEELESGIVRLQEEINEEHGYEERQRKELAEQCHVSVEQIIEWENEQRKVWQTHGSLHMAEINRDYIESLPVEPYEEAHHFELGKAA